MADFTMREVTQTTRQYILPNPTSLGEVAKVAAFIERAVDYSTPVAVQADETEITFSFVLDTKVTS